MEDYEYTRILLDVGVEINGFENNTWKPLMRQCLIASGVCCINFLQGLFLGAPTVIIAQIRENANSTEVINDEMSSWLTTFPVINALPAMIILPLLFNRLGRKLTFLFVCINIIIGFIIFYNSTNLTHVLISEIFAGPALASTITISPVIISEYTSPRYRGIFLTLKSASAFWGIWTSNAIGTFCYWKKIALFAFVCSVYLLSVMAWPESPHWLAKKARYVESAKAHRWLKGVNKNSEKELAQLINSEKQNNNVNLALDNSDNNNSNFYTFPRLSRMWSIIKSRSFYKPVLICVLLITQYNFTGKVVISMYAIQVLKHLTSDQSFVYTEMLILDGVTVFSMYIGCIISRYLNRRTLLLLSSGIGILFLYILSLYLYLVSLSVIMKNDVVILAILTAFSIAISCGPIILCTSICGEIIPTRYQKGALMLIGSYGIIIMSLLLKLSPLIFKSFQMHGSFLLFGITSTVFFRTLYVHLPETKDKTIQDIEKIFTKPRVVEGGNKTTARGEFEINNLILSTM